MTTNRICAKKRYGHNLSAEDTVYVGRRWNLGGHDLPESIWHNPYRVGTPEAPTAKAAVKAYRRYLTARLLAEPGLCDALEVLRGKKLACFCELGAPCHGDVLCELLNSAPKLLPAWTRTRQDSDVLDLFAEAEMLIDPSRCEKTVGTARRALAGGLSRRCLVAGLRGLRANGASGRGWLELNPVTAPSGKVYTYLRWRWWEGGRGSKKRSQQIGRVG